MDALLPLCSSSQQTGNLVMLHRTISSFNLEVLLTKSMQLSLLTKQTLAVLQADKDSGNTADLPTTLPLERELKSVATSHKVMIQSMVKEIFI